MTKNALLMMSLLTLAVACANTDGEVALSSDAGKEKSTKPNTSIKGTFTGVSERPVYLEFLSANAIEKMDTVMTSADGNFAFDFRVDIPGYYRIGLDEKNICVLIVLPKDKITVIADGGNIYGTYEVSKSDESIRLKNLNRILVPRDSINMAFQNAQMTKDQVKYNEVVSVYEAIMAKVTSKVKVFIDEDPGTLSSLAAVQNLNIDQEFGYYIKVVDALKGVADGNQFYDAIATQVNQQRKLAVGSPAPEISLPQANGEIMNLSDLRGQYVLIDFWASWCGPCRKENPNVVRVYNKYHDKGFEILGVSLDKNMKAWQNAIQQDGLTWEHISDLKFWGSAVVPEYQVKGIPLTYLVDPEGNIVGKNLRGPSLENKLKEIFGE